MSPANSFFVDLVRVQRFIVNEPVLILVGKGVPMLSLRLCAQTSAGRRSRTCSHSRYQALSSASIRLRKVAETMLDCSTRELG